MSSHETPQQHIPPDGLDSLIRWALHDSVAEAEPSSRGWEQLKQRVAADGATPFQSARRSRRTWSFAISRPKFTWHLPLYDLGANRLVHAMRTVESGMPILRLVS